MLRILNYSVLVLALLSAPAFAYLDPGTGSYLLQLVLAGILGALLSIKLFWGKIKEFFRSLFTRDKG